MDSRDVFFDRMESIQRGSMNLSESHKQVPSAAHSRVTSKYGMENIPTVVPPPLTFSSRVGATGGGEAQAARGPRCTPENVRCSL